MRLHNSAVSAGFRPYGHTVARVTGGQIFCAPSTYSSALLGPLNTLLVESGLLFP